LIIVWLPDAITTRDAQLDYIAQKNFRAAIEQGDCIASQVNQLEQNPKQGRPGRKKGTRELVINHTNFIVVYYVKPRTERIEIWRVLHTSQAWPA
jgi:toxin ParE1/3/4